MDHLISILQIKKGLEEFCAASGFVLQVGILTYSILPDLTPYPKAKIVMRGLYYLPRKRSGEGTTHVCACLSVYVSS